MPLATVCVAFRGAASAQTPENAGLFHLYEHMLFDGNEKYQTQAAFMAALNKLGVANWNGSTGTQYINYYITLPSDKLAEGIEFWSWAVKKPVFDADKLEREKQVVINEIRGYHTDPDQIAEEALESREFSTYPWRKNIDGPEETIQKATIDQLEAIRGRYYIPRNTALLIGGDVKADEVFALAEKYFGDWKGGAAPVIGEPPQGPVPAGIALVYPDDASTRASPKRSTDGAGPTFSGRPRTPTRRTSSSSAFVAGGQIQVRPHEVGRRPLRPRVHQLQLPDLPRRRRLSNSPPTSSPGSAPRRATFSTAPRPCARSSGTSSR